MKGIKHIRLFEYSKLKNILQLFIKKQKALNTRLMQMHYKKFTDLRGKLARENFTR